MMLANIKKYILDHKKELLFVLLIFILGFAVRGELIKYTLFFEFDSYYHGRMVEYFLENGNFPSVDTQSYYYFPQGGAPLPSVGMFFWLVTGILFKLATFWMPFNKDLLIVAIKFYPAIFGGLTCVAMYYLGKTAFGKKAGITFAFFAAVIPAFVYRTMAGFFEDDSLGFLPLIISMIFFVRAMRNAEFNRDTIVNSVLSGFFMFIMAITWQGFYFAWMIFPAWFIGTLSLMIIRKEGTKHLIAISKNFAIFFAIMAVGATLFTGISWFDTAFVNAAAFLPVTPTGFEQFNAGKQNNDPSILGFTIGEEQKGYPFFGNKYGALIVFAPLAIGIFLFGLISLIWNAIGNQKADESDAIIKSRKDHVSLLIFFWIILSLGMAYTKLKYTYVFGLPLAAAAGVTVFQVFSWLDTKAVFEKKFAAIAFGFLFITGVAAGTFFVSQNVPTIEDNTGWKQGLYWLRDNTPEDAKLFNWWDQGHWLAFIAEKRVLIDNRNFDVTTNYVVASFVIAEDLNAAHEIIKKYDSDYIVFSDSYLNNLNSMAVYAYTKPNPPSSVLKYFGNVIDCSQRTDSLTGVRSVICGGQSIPYEQFIQLPTSRTETPNWSPNNREMGFLYRNAPGTKLYALNSAANNTMLARLALAPESISWVQQVYKEGDVMIFKVVK